jgi:ABC-type polysaccharide/polyol phosphate transport system ATPase subunit
VTERPVAIAARGLSKRYRLREQGGVAELTRRLRGATAESDSFWALRDVSFTIHPGEVVGIIGHNGAGKSTLLKILTRITTPTAGSALVQGRVGMLLEVGTGFHTDLTGRENVFMGGAILGMGREEIRRKYDAIVDFAETGPFMDLPVGHYSSGMSLRLALSVAIHLEAEVIFLDEVWAVGDHAFQVKSLRRIEELIGAGRTFVIVSHNLGTIARLCSRCLLIDHGRLTMDDAPGAVIARYRKELRQRRGDAAERGDPRAEAGGFDVQLAAEEVDVGGAVELLLKADLAEAATIRAAVALRDGNGRTVAIGAPPGAESCWAALDLPAGGSHRRCVLPVPFVVADHYDLTVELRRGDVAVLSAELPFTLVERGIVLVDETGEEQAAPAVPAVWSDG